MNVLKISMSDVYVIFRILRYYFRIFLLTLDNKAKGCKIQIKKVPKNPYFCRTLLQP